MISRCWFYETVKVDVCVGRRAVGGREGRSEGERKVMEGGGRKRIKHGSGVKPLGTRGGVLPTVSEEEGRGGIVVEIVKVGEGKER